MNDLASVWLVVGVQASGKSTIAELLARQFDPAVHVRGGQFYRWVTSGWQHPTGSIKSSQASRLLDLRYRLSALAADQYCAEGFTTVVQDNIYGDDVSGWLDRITSRPRYLVVLRPSLDVVAEREAERMRRTGKVAYRPDGFAIKQLDDALALTPQIGLWLDTSGQSPEDTVSEILRRRAEALVE